MVVVVVSHKAFAESMQREMAILKGKKNRTGLRLSNQMIPPLQVDVAVSRQEPLNVKISAQESTPTASQFDLRETVLSS